MIRNKKSNNPKALIMAQVLSFMKTNHTNESWEDLFQTAFLNHLEAMARYDSKKGSLSTYITACAQNTIIKCLKRERTRRFFNRDIPNYVYETDDRDGIDSAFISEITPEHKITFKQIVEGMSKDARAVCKIIFVSPHNFVASHHGKNRIKREIRKSLTNKNWSQKRINRAFKEIRFTLQTI